MRKCLPIVLLLCSAVVLADEPAYTADFPLKSCLFSPFGGNDFFPIRTGRQLYYTNAACVAEGECEELEELWITAERDIRRITLGSGWKKQVVYARVLEERETEDGELKEVSRNFISTCLPSRDVYYFGEEVDDYEDGEIVGHEGAWLAGVDGAQPGILMPDSAFILGMRYFQEFAPGVALDRAEHVESELEITVPAGTFQGCIRIHETSPLEPGSESEKVYCPGVGMVVDDDLELAAIYSPRHHWNDD